MPQRHELCLQGHGVSAALVHAGHIRKFKRHFNALINFSIFAVFQFISSFSSCSARASSLLRWFATFLLKIYLHWVEVLYSFISVEDHRPKTGNFPCRTMQMKTRGIHIVSPCFVAPLQQHLKSLRAGQRAMPCPKQLAHTYKHQNYFRGPCTTETAEPKRNPPFFLCLSFRAHLWLTWAILIWEQHWQILETDQGLRMSHMTHSQAKCVTKGWSIGISGKNPVHKNPINLFPH